MSETLPLATEEGAILYLPQGAVARAQYIDKLAPTDPTDDAKITVVIGGVAYNTTWGALKAANLDAVPEVALAAIASDVQTVQVARQRVEDNAASAAVSEQIAADAADLARDDRIAAEGARSDAVEAAERARNDALNVADEDANKTIFLDSFADLPAIGVNRQRYTVLAQQRNYRYYTARPGIGTPGYVDEGDTTRALDTRQTATESRVGAGPGQDALAFVDRRGRASGGITRDGAMRMRRYRVGRAGRSTDLSEAELADTMLSLGDRRGRQFVRLLRNALSIGGARLTRTPLGGWQIITTRGEIAAEFSSANAATVAGLVLEGASVPGVAVGLRDRRGRIFAVAAQTLPNASKVAGIDIRGASIPGVTLGVLDKRGRVYNAAKGSNVVPPSTVALPTGYSHVLYHVMMLSQSWGGGVGGVPPLSTTPRDGILMFAGGIRPTDGGTDPAIIYASLQPAVEATLAGNVRGETPLSGLARMFAAMALADDGVAPERCKLLLSGVTPGGIPLRRLLKSQPNSYYPDILAQVAAGYARAQEMGWTYRLAACPVMIGHGDYGEGEVDGKAWQAKFEGWIRDINADVRLIVPDHPPVQFFPYQTLSHTHAGRAPTVDLVLRDSARTNPLVTLVGPMYPYPRSDSTHYTAAGSKAQGVIGGTVVKQTLIAGKKRLPLDPVEVIRQGRLVTLRFEPVGPLVLDTSLVANPGNYGFSLVDPDGAPLAVSSVELVGRDMLVIRAAAAVPVGAKVRSAWAGTPGAGIGPQVGPRTCLRDSQGDTFAVDGIAAHRWCTLFEIPLI